MTAFRHFLSDQTGAMSGEFVMVVGGSMLMGYTIVTDISRGALTVADNITVALDDVAKVHLMMNDSPNNSASGTPTPTSGSKPPSDEDPASTPSTNANPGNDKNVGNAGETPNGQGDWGAGSNGRSR